MRISSHILPQYAAYFSDGPTRHHRSWPTPRPRWAVFALLKTRNRLWGKVSYLLDTFAEMSRRKPMMYHGTDSCYDRMLGILVSDGSAPKRRRQSWQQAHSRSSEPRTDNFTST